MERNPKRMGVGCSKKLLAFFGRYLFSPCDELWHSFLFAISSTFRSKYFFRRELWLCYQDPGWRVSTVDATHSRSKRAIQASPALFFFLLSFLIDLWLFCVPSRFLCSCNIFFYSKFFFFSFFPRNLFVTAPQMTTMLRVWHRRETRSEVSQKNTSYSTTYAVLTNQWGQQVQRGDEHLLHEGACFSL